MFNLTVNNIKEFFKELLDVFTAPKTIIRMNTSEKKGVAPLTPTIILVHVIYTPYTYIGYFNILVHKYSLKL